MSTISHLDHIAIVVRSLNEVRAFYEEALGLSVSHIEEMPDRGIRTMFIRLGSTMLELIEPLHEASEVSTFLEKRGPGLHHIAVKTNDIDGLQEKLAQGGAALIYEAARPGAHGSKVNFIHPRSAGGVLVEIVE